MVPASRATIICPGLSSPSATTVAGSTLRMLVSLGAVSARLTSRACTRSRMGSPVACALGLTSIRCPPLNATVVMWSCGSCCCTVPSITVAAVSPWARGRSSRTISSLVRPCASTRPSRNSTMCPARLATSSMAWLTYSMGMSRVCCNRSR